MTFVPLENQDQFPCTREIMEELCEDIVAILTQFDVSVEACEAVRSYLMSEEDSHE